MSESTLLRKLLLSAREAAEVLSISERKLFDLTAPRGDLPAVRIGRAVRYAVTDLEDWIAARNINSRNGE